MTASESRKVAVLCVSLGRFFMGGVMVATGYEVEEETLIDGSWW